jgi:hypothetical protein
METTEKIIESYVRYVRRWATIPNVKCDGQYEIDLLAIDPRTVPVGNLRPEILVMQPAQNWHRQRATDGLDSTWDWRVLVQR